MMMTMVVVVVVMVYLNVIVYQKMKKKKIPLCNNPQVPTVMSNALDDICVVRVKFNIIKPLYIIKPFNLQTLLLLILIYTYNASKHAWTAA